MEFVSDLRQVNDVWPSNNGSHRDGAGRGRAAPRVKPIVRLLRKGGTEMFEKERFIEDCRAALKEGDTHAAIRELVATAVSEPMHVLRALGEPQRAGVETIYRADDLTILNLCWGPWMKFKPHDHRMWAVIGIYGGRGKVPRS